ncbi:MAG TPA: hypothetical protein EYO73_08355 [Sulfurimonas sp.]|nr:hypothetical protein [Sulfurimonas sp.]
MVYEIFMPQLSDSMEEGKLIAWMVKVNDTVKIGDVIAEVESDKAIMEVQCFKNGIIKSLHIQEGESAPVGTVILSVEIDKEITRTKKSLEPEVELEENVPKVEYTLNRAIASPKARLLAQSLGINIQALQDEYKLPVPSHEKDIILYRKKKFFTPKALFLIESYHLDINDFQVQVKQDSYSILEYIKEQDISIKRKIPAFQKALIKNLDKSALKAVYHIYDYIDTVHFEKHNNYSMTAWLMKVFSRCMMDFEGFRSSIKEDYIHTSVNAHISIAMQEDKKLFMPVLKDVNLLDIKSIQDKLAECKMKVQTLSLNLDEMQGSNFGLSNLGFTGIHRFDAMINQEDSSIAAIGASTEGKMSLTLSLDHRLINGYEAALFMQRVKEVCLDKEFFKEEIKHV